MTEELRCSMLVFVIPVVSFPVDTVIRLQGANAVPTLSNLLDGSQFVQAAAAALQRTRDYGSTSAQYLFRHEPRPPFLKSSALCQSGHSDTTAPAKPSLHVPLKHSHTVTHNQLSGIATDQLCVPTPCMPASRVSRSSTTSPQLRRHASANADLSSLSTVPMLEP